jgi:hypothetical protein
MFQDGKLLKCIHRFLLNGQLFNFNISITTPIKIKGILTNTTCNK